MTRQFNVKDEVEVKDDLDNKPDNEEALAIYKSAVRDVYRAAKDVASAIPELMVQPTYEYDMSVNLLPSGLFYGHTRKSGVDSGRFWPSFRLLNKAFPHLREKEKDQMKVNFVLSSTEFEFKLTLNQLDSGHASAFVEAFGNVLSNKRSVDPHQGAESVYGYTSISSQNNQVFIVSRLPRAGLDSLLATDAK